MCRELLKELFRRLDIYYSGCPNPAFLPAHQRFQGRAVIEKHNTNAHIHLLLSFANWLDQHWAGMFLLEMLDNVDKTRDDPDDEAWARLTWDLVAAGRGWSKDRSRTRTSSVLTPLAPAGTAMVQMVGDKADLRQVVRYMTKTWHQSTARSAARTKVTSYDPVFDFHELSEFQTRVEAGRIARLYRIDPVTGGQVLDLDNLVYKSKGRIVR